MYRDNYYDTVKKCVEELSSQIEYIVKKQLDETLKNQIADMIDNVIDEKIGDAIKTHAKRMKDDLLVELVRNALNLDDKGEQ